MKKEILKKSNGKSGVIGRKKAMEPYGRKGLKPEASMIEHPALEEGLTKAVVKVAMY